jgi:hypothetical protein
MNRLLTVVLLKPAFAILIVSLAASFGCSDELAVGAPWEFAESPPEEPPPEEPSPGAGPAAESFAGLWLVDQPSHALYERFASLPRPLISPRT